eukprot:SAG31_NODE_8204_length_1497_cov_1.656652_3_plen_215_part_01
MHRICRPIYHTTCFIVICSSPCSLRCVAVRHCEISSIIVASCLFVLHVRIAAPPKPTGAVVPMCTTRPSYGSHSPRRGPDVSIRPDGAPAKGLRHGSSTFRPTPPARTPEFARSRPDSDLGNLSTRLLATSRAATLGATAGTGSVGSASSIEGSNERPRMPCRPLKLITGSTAVGQSSITPPASANYCRLPPVQMVEKHHGLLYKSVEIRSEQPG